MVTQYPNTATATHVTASTTLANGDIVSGVSMSDQFKCRLEPAGGGYVGGVGGIQVDFTWVVYCAKGTPVLPIGSTISVVDWQGEILCSDRVKQFSVGQLNCRIWL